MYCESDGRITVTCRCVFGKLNVSNDHANFEVRLFALFTVMNKEMVQDDVRSRVAFFNLVRPAKIGIFDRNFG